ncbi:hypothetical protein D3C81_2145170 [compost metagenome]
MIGMVEIRAHRQRNRVGADCQRLAPRSWRKRLSLPRMQMLFAVDRERTIGTQS